ncbi:hypothetical protein ACOSQ3_003295 [Xanthoceras sorbifolium]
MRSEIKEGKKWEEEEGEDSHELEEEDEDVDRPKKKMIQDRPKKKTDASEIGEQRWVRSFSFIVRLSSTSDWSTILVNGVGSLALASVDIVINLLILIEFVNFGFVFVGFFDSVY